MVRRRQWSLCVRGRETFTRPADWARTSPCSDFNESNVREFAPPMSPSKGDSEELWEIRGEPQSILLFSPVPWLCYLVHIYVFAVKERVSRFAAELASSVFEDI